MEHVAGPSCQRNGQPETMEVVSDNEEAPVAEPVLCIRAAQVKEKHQDSTLSWIMKTLDVIFEYYPNNERSKPIADLTEVVEKFCHQDIEHTRSKQAFDKFCRMHPIKNSPKEFDYVKELNKVLSNESKVKLEEVKGHPKYLKFIERIKELERGKELSQTEAISVD